MTTHMKNKHGGQTFECLPCDKKFSCKVAHLILHIYKLPQDYKGTHVLFYLDRYVFINMKTLIFSFQAYLTSHQKSSCKERFRKLREMNAQRALLS